MILRGRKKTRPRPKPTQGSGAENEYVTEDIEKASCTGLPSSVCVVCCALAMKSNVSVYQTSLTDGEIDEINENNKKKTLQITVILFNFVFCVYLANCGSRKRYFVLFLS